MGHIMVTTRYSAQQKSKLATKPLPRSNQPRTSATYRHQDDVFVYELQFLLSINGVLPSYRQDCLMCCPFNKVIKSHTRRCLALGGLLEDKSCDTLQAIAPINVKTVLQTSLLRIENNLDRLGLLLPTHGQRSQQQSGRITFQSLLINKSKFFRATHHAEIKKIEYRGPWWWRP